MRQTIIQRSSGITVEPTAYYKYIKFVDIFHSGLFGSMAAKITMTIVPLEKSDMLEKVNNFPDNVAEAFTLSKDIVLPSNYSNISNILVLGMGGSGIVGDFIRVLLRNSAIPVHVNKHMLPPRFVNENTLVLAITYSGKTEETRLR